MARPHRGRRPPGFQGIPPEMDDDSGKLFHCLCGHLAGHAVLLFFPPHSTTTGMVVFGVSGRTMQSHLKLTLRSTVQG